MLSLMKSFICVNVGHEVRQSEVRQMVVAERAVVEAYGKVEARDDVATKYEDSTLSPTTALADTESGRYGDVVPIPTLPEK